MARKPTQSEPAIRLFRAAPVIVVTAGLAGSLALIEPRTWPAALGGLALAILAAALTPSGREKLADSRQTAGKNREPEVPTGALIEALEYPAYLLDEAAVVRYANRAGEEAFGATRTGEPVSLKFRRPEIAKLAERAIAENRTVTSEYEERVPRERWFTVSATPVGRHDDEPSRRVFLLAFRENTQTRRAEQMRSDFIANASHELRTPLASLRGFIETLQGPARGDAKATGEFLQVMLGQAERMSRLIDDLLSLSRIEMRLHQPPREIVDIAAILAEVAGALAPLATSLGVEIVLKLPGHPLPVPGDRDELFQVFVNLTENACKYGQAGGKVELEARVIAANGEELERIEAGVTDFGPGIAPEHLPRLTERFYRVEAETSREKKGTGLGLAIVKHILNRHGTRLNIRSELGQGASFTAVFLPEREAGGGQAD